MPWATKYQYQGTAIDLFVTKFHKDYQGPCSSIRNGMISFSSSCDTIKSWHEYASTVLKRVWNATISEIYSKYQMCLSSRWYSLSWTYLSPAFIGSSKMLYLQHVPSRADDQPTIKKIIDHRCHVIDPGLWKSFENLSNIRTPPFMQW